MRITPDSLVFLGEGFLTLNGTIVFSWITMIILVGVSAMVTRRLAGRPPVSRMQTSLEVVVSALRRQIGDMVGGGGDRLLAFIGSLYLFIAVSNLLAIVPYYEPPTGSLSATAALAAIVFVSVPAFGIAEIGLKRYLKHYIQPSVFMLPFNIISEVSRTFSLGVRLFGNIMSGTVIVGILISVVPLFAPVVMQVLGLIIGQVQAYIFAALSTVYIASATRAQGEQRSKQEQKES